MSIHYIRYTHDRMFHFASCQPKPQIPGRQQRSFASVDRGHLYSPPGLKGLFRIY